MMDRTVSYGLSNKEVIERVRNGQVNKLKKDNSNSYKRIFFSNIFTFFNLVNSFLFLLVLFTGSLKNALFAFVVFSNVFINMYQEIRAKRTLDKLNLLKVAKVQVYRDNKLQTIPINQIVIDDYILLKNGDQIAADSIVFDGTLEVNESLLTGEVDSIFKKQEDKVYSGSFVTSGSAICKVICVGEDNYIQKIRKEATSIKKGTYMIQSGLNQMIKVVSIILIPLCSFLFLRQVIFNNETIQYGILHTVSAAVGMFPEGLFLLTSIVLTISAVYLSRKNVLVQNLQCIESLARVDVLCLDKTGTITEGKMTVEKIIPYQTDYNVNEIMNNLMFYLTDKNPTAEALRNHYSGNNTFKPTNIIPFSSERKYSSVSFENRGTYYLGAASFLFHKGNKTLFEQEKEYAKQGYRVIVLGHSSDFNKTNEDQKIPDDLTLVSMFLLSDTIRDNAEITLKYFDEQNVNCKIISGDDPATVSQIAKKVHLPGADKYIDVSTITSKNELEIAVEKYQIFGRVSPQQKKEIISLLKEQGHTVAMMGDGVNDVLALKESDCSIAMVSGAESARQVSDLVLLNNDFNSMPEVVNEGRRVINNVTKSGSLVLIQVLYSFIVTMGVLLLGTYYPFEPIQLTIINACFVGIPTFLLNLESDVSRVKEEFLPGIFKNALPPAISIASGLLLITNYGYYLNISKSSISLMCMIFIGWNYILIQRKVYPPAEKYRKIIFLSTQLLFVVSLFLGKNFFNLASVDYTSLIFLFTLLIYSFYVQKHLNTKSYRYYKYILYKIQPTFKIK